MTPVCAMALPIVIGPAGSAGALAAELSDFEPAALASVPPELFDDPQAATARPPASIAVAASARVRALAELRNNTSYPPSRCDPMTRGAAL
jgi:hypothetical protein